MKRILFFLFLAMVLSINILPVAFAQDGGVRNPIPSGRVTNPQIPSNASEPLRLENPLGTTSTIPQLIDSIIRWLIYIGAPIAALMITVGAFQMLFAGGDEGKFANGKRTITYTAIGYAIILLAWSLTSLIRNILTS